MYTEDLQQLTTERLIAEARADPLESWKLFSFPQVENKSLQKLTFASDFLEAPWDIANFFRRVHLPSLHTLILRTQDTSEDLDVTELVLRSCPSLRSVDVCWCPRARLPLPSKPSSHHSVARVLVVGCPLITSDDVVKFKALSE